MSGWSVDERWRASELQLPGFADWRNAALGKGPAKTGRMFGREPSGTCCEAAFAGPQFVEATSRSAPSRVMAARVMAARVVAAKVVLAKVVLATVAPVQAPTGHAGSTGATVNRSLERGVVRCQLLDGRHRFGSAHILGRAAILSDPPGKKRQEGIVGPSSRSLGTHAGLTIVWPCGTPSWVNDPCFTEDRSPVQGSGSRWDASGPSA